MILFSKKLKTQVSEREELGTWSLLLFVLQLPKKAWQPLKSSQKREEAWNNLYAGYVQEVATTLVLQPLLEDEQRTKCGGVIDGP